MKTLVPFLLSVELLLAAFTTSAQDSIQHFNSVGTLVGYGHKFNMDAVYNPIFFESSFSWQLDGKKRKRFLAFSVEPQVNLVKTVEPLDLEYGINFGLRYYQHLIGGFYLYETVSSGPHYITATLERQAKGFIFSDNLAVGFFKRLRSKKPIFLNLQASVRHISNAGLKSPNWGVNTLNLLVGLSRIRL